MTALRPDVGEHRLAQLVVILAGPEVPALLAAVDVILARPVDVVILAGAEVSACYLQSTAEMQAQAL